MSPRTKPPLLSWNSSEGPRGSAVRASVAVRYLSWLLYVIVASAGVGAALENSPWASAGKILLVTSAMMSATTAIGTLFMPHKRRELIDELRQYLFHYSILPAVTISVVLAVLRHYATSEASKDQLYGLLSNSLPVMLLISVVLPALIHIRAVAGRHHLERVQQDDQEAMHTWGRHDYMQL